MKLTPFFILLSFLATTAVASPPASPSITQFKFEVQYNTGKISDNIIADIYGDTVIVGIIPYQLVDFNLKATFTASAGTVMVNGVDQQSTVTANNFSTPVTYVVSSVDGTRTYKVRLVYTGLPLVYIYTDGAAPILTREDYVSGNIKIYPNQGTAAPFTGVLQIRGRGNTTWTFPKKPYRIKLGAAASILGMPSDKDWVLLANYADKTLMRNSLAFDLGSQMNLAYTPRMTHVDVVLNGVYQGNYQLGEHIKVDKDRVNIEELDAEDTDPEKITGGYFLELDDYRDGLFFELKSGLPIVIKDPEDLPQVQQDYIKNYMQTTEDVIFSENFDDPEIGYAKYINTETFIDWYWLMEVVKNIDAKDVSSIFYYKERGEKLNMGPLWDLDVAAGNASVNSGDDPTSFYVRESKWFKRLFEDPAFKSAADARWFTFKDELLAKLPDMINQYAGKLAVSQKYNYYEWNTLSQPIWPNAQALGSYAAEVNYLQEWLSTRISWLDAHVSPVGMTSFNLTAPVNNTRVVVAPHIEGNVTFAWEPAATGSSYRVLIDTVDGNLIDPIFTYPSDSTSVDTTAVIPIVDLYELFNNVGGQDSITLKWTVRAWFGIDDKTAQDTFLITLVNGVLEVPILDSPDVNEMVETMNPTMKWFSAYRAEGYDVQLSLTGNFANLIVDERVVSDTTHLITATLDEETIYYWRTRSVNGDLQSEWSEIRSFKTPIITGIGDEVVGVSLFPNPTSSDLFIEVTSSAPIEHAELVDALGRTAARSALSPGVTKIDVSSLTRGVYIVVLRGQARKPVTRRVLLR